MQAGVDSEAMHKVFSRYLSQDLKADLHHLALRVEAKLPPPVLHKVSTELITASKASLLFTVFEY